MATGAEVPVTFVNGILSSKEKGEEYLKKFTERPLTSCEKVFYEPLKRSSIQISIEKMKKPREKEKKEAFSYLLITYPLALSTAQGILYKPRIKYLFRNYLINSSAADTMVVIFSEPSQATWEDLFKIVIKLHKLKESTEIILVFDN